jgi:hypothetical protein
VDDLSTGVGKRDPPYSFRAKSLFEGAPVEYRSNQVLLCSSLELFYEVGLVVSNHSLTQLAIATTSVYNILSIDIQNHV